MHATNVVYVCVCGFGSAMNCKNRQGAKISENGAETKKTTTKKGYNRIFFSTKLSVCVCVCKYMYIQIDFH